MKKVYFGMLSALCLTAFSGSAQQLPNVGFSEWKSACGESQSLGTTTGMRQRPGTEPASWNGSSINQKVGIEKKETLITRDEATNSAILKNVYVGVNLGVVKFGSTAPGFITLGTPWVYAVQNPLSDCDGGVYGGMDFSYTPDALSVDVTRTDTNDEDSYIIAYLWNGTFKSKIGKKSGPTDEQTDVDRAILGKTEADTKGTLVASLEKTFRTTNGKETIVVPFSYVSEAAPQKVNVIVSSGNYWDRDALKENTTVTTNNVKFIYYSKLGALSYDGKAVAGFSPDKYSYEIDATMPSNTLGFGFSAVGRSAEASIKLNPATSTATITVSNAGADSDGLSQHTYVIKFTKQAPVTEYEGMLNIEMGGESINDGGQKAKIQITETGANKCTFTLPDFSINLGDGPTSLGDIVVPDVNVSEKDGVSTYSGKADGMKLAEGSITVNVTLNGTINAEGTVDMNIVVIWLYEGQEIPINVTFTNLNKQTIEGKLYINFADNMIADGQAAKVIIASTPGENTCTFSLPDFSLDLGEGPTSLGDIVVPDVTVAEANGTYTYTGKVDGMKLAEGAITADVELNGTIDASGIAMMHINVYWLYEDQRVPIDVVFTNDPAYSAITAIEFDTNAPIEYFNINGVKVNDTNLSSGIYIMRQGSKVSKVIVK